MSEDWGDSVSNLTASMKSATVSGGPNDNGSSGRGGGAVGKRVCFKCGLEGHMSRECPRAGGGIKLLNHNCYLHCTL
jgi:hypothetical protein